MDNATDHPGKWHHAPVHQLDGRGAFMVTCGTLYKVPILTTPERRDDFQSLLFELAEKFGWRLQAWAVMNNHYHWVGLSPEQAGDATSLKTLTARLHEVSTKRLNREDGTPGRRVWFNYWDSHITFASSYYARLKYVHDNPVHHGVALNAANYRWCSRSWLERTATRVFVKQLDGFKTDRLNLPDDY
jgi:putative transposase